MKVIIVDDELYFRESLKKMVPWDKIGYVISGEAHNGRDALQLVKDTRPDVILLDINMPMMDGLALAEILTEEQIPCHIIIITGYTEFEYAKKAINLDVYAYLTKPIDENELMKYLIKIRDNELANSENKKELYAIRKSAKTQMCYQLIQGNGFLNEEEIKSALTMNRSHLSGPYCQVAVIGMHTIFEEVWQSDDISLCLFSIENIINEVPTKYTKELIIMNEEGYLVLIAAYEYSEEQFIIELKKVSRMVEDILGFRLHVALGSVEKSFMCMDQSLKVAKEMYHNMRILSETSFARYGDYTDEENHMSPLTTQNRWLLASYMNAGHILHVENLIGEMFNALKLRRHMYDVYEIYISEVYTVYIEYLESKSIDYKALSRNEFMDQLLKEMNLDEGQTYVVQLFKDLIKAKNDEAFSQYSKSVTNILMYIHEHYQDESLSVKIISDQLFMNYTYISNLFKKELGIAISNYITKYRIKHARILFDEGSVVIYAVAKSVGFTDANYFGKKFKSVTGLTPSQYVNLRQESKNITT